MPPPDSSMRSLAPIVLQPLNLLDLLNLLLSQKSLDAVTLLVCSTRTFFLHQLLASIQTQDGKTAIHLLTPIIHNLFASQRVLLAFCASLPNLLAYLSTYTGPTFGHTNIPNNYEHKGGAPRKVPMLVLLNPLRLHSPTPSFSAQGLSRTFAAAVEAARSAGAKLVVVECVGATFHFARESKLWVGSISELVSGDDVEMSLGDLPEGVGGENDKLDERVQDREEEDPWDQEVPILNVSARRFGGGDRERGWAGRTVKVRRVVERWFRFERVETTIP
ncbi:hypothetical protein K432DRAFT_385817 [Lepidopterella palustris CBS 459.81]|uniref:Uncharacterized protein n=1 Tax=Lepidopterella palustris CBS 459.81 TaxID=1314670 RepID=A0A8E2E221_9PEZI|nr:hypothetical protein K432DRAFT_385817 [Lepidopterella palustris CBS 459.81]